MQSSIKPTTAKGIIKIGCQKPKYIERRVPEITNEIPPAVGTFFICELLLLGIATIFFFKKG